MEAAARTRVLVAVWVEGKTRKDGRAETGRREVPGPQRPYGTSGPRQQPQIWSGKNGE